MSIKIHGHRLLDATADKPYFAQCSCGASAPVIATPTSFGRRNARRNWHDEHKIAVLRSEGKLEEDKDEAEPVPLGTYESWGK